MEKRSLFRILRDKKIIIVILVAQIISLVSIFVLKYEMELYADKYKVNSDNSYKQVYYIDEIRAKVCMHEALLYNFVTSEDVDRWETCKNQTSALDDEIEADLVELKNVMKAQDGKFDEVTYKQVLYGIRTYLDSSDVVFELSEGTSYQVARFFALSRVAVYVDAANTTMDKLSDIAQKNLAETDKKMSIALMQFRGVFYTIVIIMGLTTVTCFIYCSRMLRLNNKYMRNAQRANEAKSTFLSNVSHEIRTPINAVLGMNEMIQRECEDVQVLEYSNNIQIAGRTLLGLINDVLDFSKIEAGKIELIAQQYNLADMVNDLGNMIRPKAKEKELEFYIEFNEKAPAVLCGDDLRLRQVIINILTNAVKYTKEGSVRLKLGFKKLDGEKILLLVEVKDTGIGMKPEEMEKLTKPFERLDEKKNHGIEGTGLGMNITSNLLKLMKSELGVTSVYGEGSTFFFEVVQEVVDWTPVEEKKQIVQEEKKKQEGPLFEAPDRCILAVDDVEMNLKVVRALLRRTKIQVDVARSGMECLELVQKKGYDVIFMDHMMPEMDGIETFERIRELEGPNQKTPVVALTANAVAGQESFYQEKGFDGYLTKPMQGADLEEKIWSYIKTK